MKQIDLEALRKERNISNPFSRYLGITVEKLEVGHAEAVLPMKPEIMNPIGSAHGGAIFAIADIAARFAVVSHGVLATTSSCDIHYLNAPREGEELITATADVIKSGKRLMISSVDVKSGSGRLVARATVTHAVIGELNLPE